jgi:starvation-inducible DNA-binding protein
MISCTHIPTRRKAVLPSPVHETQALNATRIHSLPWDRGTCRAGIVDYLHQLLADTVTLRDMYAMQRRQVSDPAFHPRYLLFDRHFAGQHVLVEEISERVQTLGGITIDATHAITERTLIPRVHNGFAEASTHLSRLLQAHEIVLVVSRATAHEISQFGTDEPTVSDVIRTNESHVWSLVHFMALENTMTEYPYSA